ncbi:aspartate/glutamate racemase family protein [Aneurinibacillus sp. REN35]|uniref:aspartate/glutamate racemase family protein n=1 Tax=Aneurinibacillus sp. REN35 TaxID=3237286 RepID=UPI003528D389
MKTIGLIGGMSWESSIEYYRLINQLVKQHLGGLHSAKSMMYSVDFEEIEQYQRTGKWEEATAMMTDIAVKLEGAGADFLVICTNTMHKMANEVQAAVAIPLLHIAEATADRIASQDITKIGLLGTKYTMEQDFYKGRLLNRGMEVLVPQEEDREAIHHIIYDELCKGTILPESKEKYKEIIGRLVAEGAEGIILGCTEITLLIKDGDSPVPLFDTTYIHAETAVELALRTP